jgi:2-polyprenyl-3-methyl-5-hydroxy-6-metoxy-1,4-benzoquinol methylase
MISEAKSVDDYGWRSSRLEDHTQHTLPVIKAALSSLHAHRVLDLGSGNGSVCAELRKLGLDVVGVEYDTNGVAIARSNHPAIPFYQYGVQDEPAALLSQEGGRLFDAVVSTEVIEHLFAPHLLPQFARALLKESGTLIVSTPYHGYLKNLALSIFNGWDVHHHPLRTGGHIKFFSRAALAQLLAESGFRVLEFHGTGRFPYLWKSMIMIAQKEPETSGPISK